MQKSLRGCGGFFLGCHLCLGHYTHRFIIGDRFRELRRSFSLWFFYYALCDHLLELIQECRSLLRRDDKCEQIHPKDLRLVCASLLCYCEFFYFDARVTFNTYDVNTSCKFGDVYMQSVLRSIKGIVINFRANLIV